MHLRAPVLLSALLCSALACSSDGDDGDPQADDGSTSSTPEPMDDSSSSSPTSATSPTSMTTVSDESSDDGEDPSETSGDPTTASDTGEPVECVPGPVRCEDEMVLDLSLNAVVSEGEVTTTADGDGWRTEVDARAGGLPGAPSNPWVYIRFDVDGAHRVDIDDFESLESDEWHLAAKRYGLRLNSGTGGPSCVTAGPVFDAEYEDITERPAVLTQPESFYDDSCTIISDGMGLGAPGYTMTPWWTYPGCVATTGVPFVIDLVDGTSIKFIVDSYYASGQETCNDTGAMGSDAGRFVWRWAFLP